MRIAALFLSLPVFVAAIGCTTPGPTQPDTVHMPMSSLATDPPPSLSGRIPQAPLTLGPHASEQVVFSGVATQGSTFANQSPAGFWIWCEAESENPYAGECNGSMYFYALKITKHVEGEVIETAEGIYQMTVSSTQDTSIVNCVLSNTAEAEHGPHNTVQVSCSTPVGSATSTNAVVNVTGP
jgi:hypothetical protein